MAKIKGPLFSIKGSGKIAESIIYSENKGIKTAKRYEVPVNPKSDDQKVQRDFMANAVLAWKTDGYTVADIEAWNVYAKIQKGFLSGYNLFLRNRINAEKAGITWHKLTNCIIEDITGVSCSVYVDASSNQMDRLYIGTSKARMVSEHTGFFEGDRYKYSVTNLSPLTRYYFNVHNLYEEKAQRTGIYSVKTIAYVPSPLSVGNFAIDRWDMIGGGVTMVDKFNPANKNGTITKVAIYCPFGIPGVKVASFFVVEGNFLSTRNYELIGAVPSGYSEHEVSIGIQEGDFIGLYCGAGDIDTDDTGLGRWAQTGDKIPCTNQEFFYSAGATISLYGSGPA